MYRNIALFLIVYLSNTCVFAKGAETEKQKVINIPFYDSHRPPLIYVGENYAGIHAEIFMKVLTGAGIKFNFQPTPHKRRRLLFEAGEVTVDCCSNPEWRQRPKESELQLFSDAIDVSADHYIFNESKQFDIKSYSDLKSNVVGLIRGFSYSGSENFGHIVNIKTEEQLLEMLNLKRIDVAIVNKQVAEYYIKKKQLNLVIGPLHDEKTLHIRINKLNEELLPKLNSVINQIIQSGERDKLINKYLNK